MWISHGGDLVTAEITKGADVTQGRILGVGSDQGNEIPECEKLAALRLLRVETWHQ